jgi:predicted amidohydrolase YtcJ
VAVADGRILAVGPRVEVEAALPAGHLITDLGGRTLAPGFVDAHLHPMALCFYEHHVDLSAATALDEVADLLADRAAQVGPGDWVVGHRLDEEAMAEGRLPSRRDLDRIGAGRPVLVIRRDGHHALGSTAALAAAGIDRTTPDPAGGVIHHDADGELSGLCGEAAAALLIAAVPLPSWDEFGAALDQAVRNLARQGVTGISAMCQTSDVGPAGQAGELEAVAWAMLLERVPFDVQNILIAADPTTVQSMQEGELHRPARRRRLDAVKLFLDGTLGGRTACMHHPYSDAGGAGMLTLEPEAAYAQMAAAHLAGLQICIHAIGDRANRTAADLFARLRAEHPGGDNRHRIEHASVLDDETVDLLAELGVSTVVQPVSIESERRWLGKRLGDHRLGRVYPYRRLIDAGVHVAGSSDAPIETYDVLAAMHAAVDRRGIAPDQAITPLEALAAYTTEAAYVRHVDDDTGRIEPGHHADLVVLSGDPREALQGVEVLETMVGGQVLHHDDRLDGPAVR